MRVETLQKAEAQKPSAPAKRGAWRSAKRKGADLPAEPAQPKRPKADLKKITAPLLRILVLQAVVGVDALILDPYSTE